MAMRYSRLAGVSGTVNVVAGTVINKIRAHSTAGGTITVATSVSGDTITITVPAGVNWEYDATNSAAPAGWAWLLQGAGTVVFSAGVDSYFIEYMAPG